MEEHTKQCRYRGTKWGWQNFAMLYYLLKAYTETTISAHCHSSGHTHISFRILYGHTSDHLDFSEGLLLCPMVSLQYDTAKRLYSTKTKHNVLRPRKTILSHLRTLTAPPLFPHFKVKLIHLYTKNLTILRRFKHQVWIYIGIFVLIFVI